MAYPTLLCILLFSSYLLIVQQLRNRRLQALLKLVNRDCGNVLKSSDLPLYHAEFIAKQIATYEFPWMMNLALQFALFRTYGIPTISSLLWKTRQLAQRSTAHKRYVDTSLLIIEIMSFPLDSPRSKVAIERINYLHNRHRNSISNDDLLYTLSLFMCQPAVFIDRYEWRKLDAIEKIGLHRFWSEVGVRMGIKGIPNSFEATYSWANKYEERCMIPNDTNPKVAEATVDILLYFTPGILHNIVQKLIRAICDQRLRSAFSWQEPPKSASTCINLIFYFRANFLRMLCLPRIMPLKKCSPEAINKSAPLLERRYYYRLWDTDPWYLEATWWNSYGPTGLMCRLMGWGVPGKEFLGDQGYRIGEVGPRSAEGKGAGNAGWTDGLLLGGGSIVGGNDDRNDEMPGGRCPMLLG